VLFQRNYIPFSALNLSHASLRVENTAELIIFTSVLAPCDNCDW
jgi:hypothetical protein